MEGEREERGDAELMLNSMGSVGCGPERSFQGLPTPARVFRDECLLSAGHHNDSVSWGLHQQLLRNTQGSYLQAKGNPAGLPPSPPPRGTEWPVRSLSPASVAVCKAGLSRGDRRP